MNRPPPIRRLAMTELRWFEAFPPRTLSLTGLTGLVRVLAGRPRLGLRQLQPVVTFEVWLNRTEVRWLVGCDEQVARHLPGELAAQLPALSLVTVKESPRVLRSQPAKSDRRRWPTPYGWTR